MNYIISLVVPTRGRIPLLKKMVNSAFLKARYPEKVELILLYDSDDIPTKNSIIKLKQKYSNYTIVDVEIYMNDELAKQGINIHENYFGPGARMSRSPVIWELGNDVEIQTQNYDKIITEEVKKFLIDKPDRLAYISIDHDHKVKTPGFCCFPAFTKEHIETVGCGVVQEISSWGSDSATWQIYNNLCANRILDLTDQISVVHWSYHSQRTHKGQEIKENDKKPEIWEGDEISYRLSTKKLNLTHSEYMSYINKLNKRIIDYSK